MQKNVGIVRTHDEMIEALNGLDSLRSRAARTFVPGNIDFNPGWHTALDLKNVLTVSEAIARSALERTSMSSRTSHPSMPSRSSIVRS